MTDTPDARAKAAQIIAEQLVTVTEVWMPYALACQMVDALAAAGLRVEPASAAPEVMDLAARIQIAVADNRVLLEACNWESLVSLAAALQAVKRERDEAHMIVQNYRLGSAWKQSDWDALIECAEIAEARVKDLEAALRHSRNVFLNYAEDHRLAGKTDKAERNQKMADECESALAPKGD